MTLQEQEIVMLLILKLIVIITQFNGLKRWCQEFTLYVAWIFGQYLENMIYLVSRVHIKFILIMLEIITWIWTLQEILKFTHIDYLLWQMLLEILIVELFNIFMIFVKQCSESRNLNINVVQYFRLRNRYFLII